MTASNSRGYPRAQRIALAVTTAFLPYEAGLALPTGEHGIVGDVTVSRPTTQTMQINQPYQKGIVNWQGFSIGAAEHVNISQPSASAALLNRVVGNSPSEIYGRLTANGQVFLVNNAGVLFARGASVEVGSLLASTLSITDQNFLNGTYQFYNPGTAGSVVNQGSIVTAGGFTALIGPQVRNDGVIVATSGSVALAAGNAVSLTVGDGMISVVVAEAAFNASVVNTGEIRAEGGTVLLKASSMNALLDTVINTSGIVRATGLVEQDGEIVLQGTGNVQVAGTVAADREVDIAATGALNVGSTVCCVGTQITSASQEISAGSITVGGGATVTTSTGTQTITTPGTLLVRGGILAGDVGFFHNGSGEQAITAGSIEVRGGSGASATRAVIASNNAAASQNISVGGSLVLTGGTVGDSNIAVIRSAGTQTVDADSISLTSGSSGTNNGAILLGRAQVITTTGDVKLSGNTGGGTLAGVRMGGLSVGSGAGVNTPTNLTLNVGRDLLMTGGTAPNNVAIIGSTAGQAQTMTISAGRDVVLSSPVGSIARIGIAAPVTPGDVSVTAGRDLSVNGGGEIRTGGMLTLEAGGALTLSATSPTAGGATVSSQGGQSVRAKSLKVEAGFGRLATLENLGTGDQSITLLGGAPSSGLDVQTASTGGQARIANFTPGAQTITVQDGDHLNVHGVGAGQAIITAAGAQTIDMASAGPKRITLGSHDAKGTSFITANGNQTINGNADITLIAGSSPIDGNSDARISALNPLSTQTIHAGALALANSNIGGASSFAGILGANQTIITTGNVTLQGGASGSGSPGVRIGGLGSSAPSATNLFLDVGGDLVLAGGTVVENGAAIGSSGSSAIAMANTIRIEADGSVRLNAGSVSNTGVRIGYGGNGPAGGNISIKADGSIELNGTQRSAAIRTTDDVSLEAASISERGNGFILAKGLTLNTTGDATLTGANQVASLSAPFVFPTPPAAPRPGVGGNLNFNNVGSLNVNSAVESGGTMTVTVGGALNVIGAGAQDAVLRSRGGQTITAQSLNLTAQDGRRANIENQLSGNQTVTATLGGMNLQVPGAFGVAQITNTAVGGNQTVSVAGQLNVLGGVISPTGSRNSGLFKQAAGGTQSVTAAGITLAGASSGSQAGALINSQGDQTVSVNGGDITLVGGSGGNGNNAQIAAPTSGATQTINARHISMRNGVGGIDTFAGLFADNQTITATGNVTLTSEGALASNLPNAPRPGVRIGAPGASTTGTNLTLSVGGNLELKGSTTTVENGAAIGSTGQGTARPNTIDITAGGNVILNAGTLQNTGVRIGSADGGTAGGNITIRAGTIMADGSIRLNGTQRSAAIRTLDDVSLQAASISESGNGFILADQLSTTTTANTNLTGPNRIAAFNATSGGDVSLNNTGILNVTGLTAAGNANISNIGNVTVGGPWGAGGTSSIFVHSDLVLDALLSSTDVVLSADGSITAFGSGAVHAGTLATESGGATTLAGENRVSNYSGSAGTGLFLFNRGALDVSSLSAQGASLSNDGSVTISGPWVSAGQTNISAFGFGSRLSETAGGFIEANGFNGLSADGGVNLNGANRISGNLFGSSMFGDFRLTNAGDLSFGVSTFSGDVNLVNTGALNVTSVAARNAAVANTGTMTLSGFWNSTAATSIDTTGDLTVTSSVFSNGPMSLEIDGALTVEASGFQGASLTSFAGQTIQARSVALTSRDGQFAVIGNNNLGEQTITASGGGIEIQSVSGGGFAFITNGFGTGNQTINSSGAGIGVRLVEGDGSAQINNFGSGSQTINVSGGALEVEKLAGNGFVIVNNGGPGVQAINASDGGGVRVRSLSAGGLAQLSSFGGGQTIDASGGGVEVSALGPNTFASLFNGSGSQSIDVSGGTGLVVLSAGGSAAIGSNGFGGQAIEVSGASLDVRSNGGSASINSGFGQSIAIDGEHLRVLGAGGNASIFANGSQAIAMTAAGPKQIVLGDHAAQGRSTISSNGNQTISGNADITLIGGSGPIADASNAIISVGNPNRQQTIHAHNITLENSRLGGNNSVAGIQAAHQLINATGDVRLTANASGGNLPGVRIGGLGGAGATPTNLILNVGGDLVLTAGSAVNNGVGIGSTAAAGAPAFRNDITANVGGSVLLNAGTLAGTGVRIGSSAATGAGPGNINITAAGVIELNGAAQGAAIRTLDTVTLNAASIAESGNGLIVAGTLNTRTVGNTTLTGPNRISAFNATSGGDVSLNNNVPLNVTGLIAAGDANISNIGNVTVSGLWDVDGTSTIAAHSDIIITGAMSSPTVVLDAADGAILESPTGSIEADTLTTFSFAETNLGGANNVDVLNSTSSGGLTFKNAGDFTLGHIETNGGAFNLEHSGDMTVTNAQAFREEVNWTVAGTLALLGGSTPGSAAQVESLGEMTIAAGNLLLQGGSGDGAFAKILGYSDISLTVGGFLTMQAGSGRDAYARIQTTSRDSTIYLTFPNLASGGFTINGYTDIFRDGKTGFLSESGVAAPGHQLILDYGAQ